MVEEEDEQYDDITKYDEATSEEGQNEAVTTEPMSEKDGSDKYVPGKPSEETVFAMPAPNGYDSFKNDTSSEKLVTKEDETKEEARINAEDKS